MNSEIRKRYLWIQLYQQTSDAGLVCRRYGISRPTLRKWVRRFHEAGEAGLLNRSRRPMRLPNRRVLEKDRLFILRLRAKRKLGARRIQSELRRHHDLRLSLDSIHKVLVSNQVSPLVRSDRRKTRRRYVRLIPRDHVQLDTCKIAPRCYQYTAVDDCTRYRVLAIFCRRTGPSTLTFLERVLKEIPFPVQRVQTDRGREFFAVSVQQWLMDHRIKFRSTKRASPHLNGRVERSQKIDHEEFLAVADSNSPELEFRLAE